MLLDELTKLSRASSGLRKLALKKEAVLGKALWGTTKLLGRGAAKGAAFALSHPVGTAEAALAAGAGLGRGRAVYNSMNPASIRQRLGM